MRILTSSNQSLRSALLASTLTLAVVGAPAAALAQDATPSASPEAVASPVSQVEADVITLMSADFDPMVPAPMTLRLLRITLEPGASTPMHTHPGPEFDLIEQGELTIETRGDAPVRRASGTPESSTGDAITLGEGDWIMFPPETGMYYINNTEDDVVMLSAVVLPIGDAYPESITYLDGQPSQDAFAGVSFKVLGDGLLSELPEGSAMIAVNSLMIPAGAPIPESEGAAMYSAVSGNFSFTVDAGEAQISRSELRSLQRPAVPGTSFSLAEGDAAFFPYGVDAIERGEEYGDLELLSLEILPSSNIEGTAASLTSIEGDGTIAEGTGSQSEQSESAGDGTTASGMTATVNSDYVNLRTDPSTSGEIVAQLNAGVEVQVIGGPTEAEDYTWYQIQVAETGEEGWIVDQYLDGLDAEDEAAATPAPATPTASPEATPGSATPEASPEADADTVDGEFAEGDTVELTEDNVLLRDAPGTESEPIWVFYLGARFTVTGDPVDVDGALWYPVQGDGQEGWLIEDFLVGVE